MVIIIVHCISTLLFSFWPNKDIKESDNIASLHEQINACDTILEVMYM